MKNRRNFTAVGSLLALSLAVLPGCDVLNKYNPFKKEAKAEKEAASEKTTDGDANIKLCSLNGNAVISESDFISNMTQMLQANPYFKGAGVGSLPMSIKRKFFDELVKQELIIVDAAKNNLQQDADFQKAYDEMIKLVKRSLTVQFFEKKIYDGISVDDAEVSKHFSENKERYVKTPGGVQTTGVRFENEKQATAFYDKVAAQANNFAKMAKSEKNGTIKDFGRLSKENNARGYQQDPVPSTVREAALAAGKLPHVAKVTSGKEFWVLQMLDQKDAEYFELDEIKPQITNMLKTNKFREALDSKLKNLRGEITVDINEDYFKEKEAQEAKSHEACNDNDAHHQEPAVSTAA